MVTDFLLDTDVISMLSPSRNTASEMFLAWLEQMDSEDRLFLSVVTIHEIEKGIALLESKGATAKASGLRIWLSGLVSTYEDKIIGFDVTAAALSGQLEARAIAAGHHPGMADAIIAGIAKARDLLVVTRNTRHFLPFGVGVISPDEAAAS
ncbi:twitching motility protein PilT [Acidithiobacillus thiooxidans]|uniref:type II toxin-antitoxin system VapC family toxin n=1 Tax=Acidithiobacillus thiooxidans TaxID=930 RepID=UPI0004B087FD|nr:type II toxin-antitoxin system VapC family toxin [Acidithiobacillus thiooxidans]OFC41089.1 twitching motility protein PilT [Acidithiobacillus thiooxidans]